MVEEEEEVEVEVEEEEEEEVNAAEAAEAPDAAASDTAPDADAKDFFAAFATRVEGAPQRRRASEKAAKKSLARHASWN